MFFAGTHCGPAPVETQVNPFPQIISQKRPSICPVSGFLIKTAGFSFNFACVLFEKMPKNWWIRFCKRAIKKIKSI